MLEALALPDGVDLVRTTPVFTTETVPAGLLGKHRVATGVWGCLRVLDGSVVFVREDTGESRRLVEGSHQVIEPDVEHHLELGTDAVFVIDFYK